MIYAPNFLVGKLKKDYEVTISRKSMQSFDEDKQKQQCEVFISRNVSAMAKQYHNTFIQHIGFNKQCQFWE